MKTKTQKKEAIDALAGALPSATIAVFTTFARIGEQGLSVAQIQTLKKALRGMGGEYIVAKKTLVEKALERLKYDGVDVYGMDGSIGLVIGRGDAYATAKALYTFAKDNKAIKMFGAWMDGAFISLTDLVSMATLPSREELLARLLGMLRYPLSSLAAVLNHVAERKMATV